MRLATLWTWGFLAMLCGAQDPALVTQQLSEWALESPDYIIPITNSDLSLLAQEQRDHYTLFLLTSTDAKHKCTSCKVMRDVLGAVSRAWHSDYLQLNYLYFVEIDLKDHSNVKVFENLGLGSVPKLWLIPPSSVVGAHKRAKNSELGEQQQEKFGMYDILKQPHAEFNLPDKSLSSQIFDMADWLAKAVSKSINIRQENASVKFLTAFLGTFFSIILVKKRGPLFITDTVTKKKVYQILFFGYLFAVLGGLSFSTIRATPFVAHNDKGKLIYISGGHLYQYAVETILVGANYFLLGASFLLLVFLGHYLVTPTSRLDERRRLGLIVLSVVTLYFLYSTLTSMFLRKNGGYPFSFAKVF